MSRFWLACLLIYLALAACASSPSDAATPAGLPVPSPTPAQATPEAVIAAPPGWLVYRDEDIGFAYPSGLTLAGEQGDLRASLSFPVDPATNVVEETVSVSVGRTASPCVSPLGAGLNPTELSPQTVERSGIPFLREGRSGVAAGTASRWVAYSAAQDGVCVSLGYTLRTFDPGNLDPTQFPNPPEPVAWEARVAVFEQILSTFVWLR